MLQGEALEAVVDVPVEHSDAPDSRSVRHPDPANLCTAPTLLIKAISVFIVQKYIC